MQRCLPTTRSVLAPAALCAIAMMAASAARPPAALANACALISTAEVAKDLHLKTAVVRPVLALPPKFGGVESTCFLNAWSGPEAATAKQAQGKLARGKLAVLSITTWEPQPEILVEEGSSNPFGKEFSKTLAGLQSEVQGQLITKLKGKAFSPPALGAETAGYRAVQAHTRKAVALWWSTTAKDHILALALTVGRTAPLLAPVKRLAATAVPAFAL